MTFEQMIVFGTLASALVLFMLGVWRYDIVALLALLVVTLTGIVPGDEAFMGFGHPAVVTVAAVLVISRGLSNAGIVDYIARWMTWVGNRMTLQVLVLTGVVALCSGFMNNVGALALLMPVALRMARRNNTSPSLLLMPIAFGSLLGGLMTVIGTPPNIIIATFRVQTNAPPFGMFDFAPVGVGVAVAGILFIALAGWRLIPRREGQGVRGELFEIEDYMTEVHVPEDSPVVGRAVRDLEQATKTDVTVVGLVRGRRKLPAPSGYEIIRANDRLIIEADSTELQSLVDSAGLILAGSQDFDRDVLRSDEISVIEAVVMPDSPLVGRTVRSLNMRWRYGVNLLAISRQGQQVSAQLRRIRFRVGDVLLLQGRTSALQEALPTLRCYPLAERGVRLGQPRGVLLPLSIFAAAVGATASGFVPVQVAFISAAIGMVLCGTLSLREAYDSIDWPVIVLLGALIPVGLALEDTGGVELIASSLLGVAGQTPPAITLVVLLVVTMFLSNVINNAAAAVIMAPIAIGLAEGLNVSADPFLMGVAIGASCAFLTPIGHQSNTLVMGPGGYQFGDYWRMGLPLEAVIVAVAVPLLLVFWPL